MLAIDLQNRVGMVTGASRGLGAAIARTLHRAGAAVAVTFQDDDAGINRGHAAAIKADLGERVLTVPLDVRDGSTVAACLQTVTARFGGIDLVINNAASSAIALSATSPTTIGRGDRHQPYRRVHGLPRLGRASAAAMRDGGRIVNLGSISAALGFFGQANYAAAKAGVSGFTRVLARELAKRRITVNAVAPGVALTEMGLSIPDQARARMLAEIPLGRFAEPDEIAALIAFLCSDLAGYITGQTLHINGGWYPS
jgi:NAD(P)-dependent dehydrogenase (short-subunit alcohol dehydrogenase family)